jgi:hypothetical protein
VRQRPFNTKAAGSSPAAFLQAARVNHVLRLF